MEVNHVKKPMKLVIINEPGCLQNNHVPQTCQPHEAKYMELTNQKSVNDLSLKSAVSKDVKKLLAKSKATEPCV